MIRISILVTDVSETRHAPYLFSRLPRHAGIGGDGAASYRDSHQAAIILRAAIAILIAAPTERNLAAARQAWREARVPYQQTEVFRFGNTAVDDWEGKVNAWPLDEGLIDYVDMSRYGDDAPDNPYASANVIAHPLLRIGGRTVDTRVLDRAALEKLQAPESGEPQSVDPSLRAAFDVAPQPLGQGGYAVVWRATEKATGASVAIKHVIDAFRSETDARRTFREIMLQRACMCEQILPLTSVLGASSA